MSNVPERLRPWIEARKKYCLTHGQVQMARELGLKPSGLDKLAGCGLRENQTLAECLAETYRKRFKKECPDDVRSIEERIVSRKIRKNEKEGRISGILETAADLRFRLMTYLRHLKSPEKKQDIRESVKAPDREENDSAQEATSRRIHSKQPSEAEIVAKFWTSITGLK